RNRQCRAIRPRAAGRRACGPAARSGADARRSRRGTGRCAAYLERTRRPARLLRLGTAHPPCRPGGRMDALAATRAVWRVPGSHDPGGRAAEPAGAAAAAAAARAPPGIGTRLLRAALGALSVHTPSDAAYITRSAVCLPNAPVDNDAVEAILGQVGPRPSRARRVVQRSNGIRSRYYAIDPTTGRPTHSNASLTAQAVRGLLGDGFALEDLALLACGTSNPDQLMPNHAVMVHGE